MWLVASFDLPAGGRADAKRYRMLRKKILAAGFSFVQESVAWRWCADHDQSRGIIGRIRKHIPAKGNVLFLQVSDASFATAVHLVDGETLDPPDPPAPWLIFS